MSFKIPFKIYVDSAEDIRIKKYLSDYWLNQSVNINQKFDRCIKYFKNYAMKQTSEQKRANKAAIKKSDKLFFYVYVEWDTVITTRLLSSKLTEEAKKAVIDVAYACLTEVLHVLTTYTDTQILADKDRTAYQQKLRNLATDSKRNRLQQQERLELMSRTHLASSTSSSDHPQYIFTFGLLNVEMLKEN